MRPLHAAALVAVLLIQPWCGSSSSEPAQPVKVLFLQDCTMYSNWQGVGMAFSFRMSGQPGTVTRVSCCTDEEAKTYDKELMKVVDTHIAPSMTINPRNGDHYAAYNKPEAVIDYMDKVVPQEEFVLVLDSDMVLRRPFLVEQMNPKKGWAVGARYTYLIGVNNELALRHIPQVAPRNDTFAGPYGRRADQVGGFFFIHRDDLKRMSHDWIKFSEDVRFDDQAYRLSGDVYAIHPGDKPWISEMYGYAFAAAKADVWHHWDIYSMIYPEYEPRDGIPKLLHYGLLFEVDSFSFDKHWHYDFDVTQCPPWDLSDPKRRSAGVFEHAPRPSELKNKKEFIMYYKDLLAIETVATLNAGFCDYHLNHCPPSKQLVDVCRETFQRYEEVRDAIRAAEAQYDCQDFHPKCDDWSKTGECEKNKDYMTENCRRSCQQCNKTLPYDPPTNVKEQLKALDGMEVKLRDESKDPDEKKKVVSEPAGGGGVASPQQQKGGKDEDVVVVPHQTGTQAGGLSGQQHDVAATKQQPIKAAVEVPPLVKAADPPKDIAAVAESPKVIAVQPTQHANKHEDAASNRKKSKDLMVRCYRLALSLTEVKECVKQAKEGKEYEVKAGTSPVATTPTDAVGKADGGKEADAVAGELSSGAHGEEDGASRRDLEDLSLTQQQGEGKDGAAASPTGDGAAAKPRLLDRLTTWQALCLWLLVVAAFLAAVPRLSRMRRRARSGMRTE